MKEKTRAQYAMLNSMTSVLIYFFRLLFQFVNRSIIISILGIKVLGISNLITSIIGVLSLAELGVGTAITYALYKPIADGDIAKRNAYLNLYRKIYKFVAIVILVAGIVFFSSFKVFYIWKYIFIWFL